MTPAEVDKLRRTARLMRERAEAVGAAEQAEWSDWMLCGVDADEAQRRELCHIASWPPVVALVVAKWLDTIAEGNGLDLTYHADESFALALCDTYLREGE